MTTTTTTTATTMTAMTNDATSHVTTTATKAAKLGILTSAIALGPLFAVAFAFGVTGCAADAADGDPAAPSAPSGIEQPAASPAGAPTAFEAKLDRGPNGLRARDAREDVELSAIERGSDDGVATGDVGDETIHRPQHPLTVPPTTEASSSPSCVAACQICEEYGKPGPCSVCRTCR